MKVLRPVWPRLILVALALVLGLFIWRFSHLGVIPAFAISFSALLANGLFLTLEDDSPGGFNNPDGLATPRYAKVMAAVFRIAFPVLCLLLAALLFMSASDVGLTTARGLALLCLGLAPVCGYIAYRTERRIVLGMLVVLIGAALVLAWVSRGF